MDGCMSSGGLPVRVLTFDVEDWFHVLDNPCTDSPARWPALESRVVDNTERILAELARRATCATFFCLGWVAERHPRLVQRIAAAGHELGTHSYAHVPIHRQSRAEFEADLVRSMRVLEDLAGRAVTCYRAPGFSLASDHPWAMDALIAHGIAADCSMFPTRRGDGAGGAPFRTPATIESPRGGSLRELPVSSGRWMGLDMVCSGAGYFRLTPYRVVRAQLCTQRYSMSWFHPRDFDPAQPSVDGLSPWRRFKARVGLDSALARFGRLLDDFAFVTVGEAVRRIDWSAAPVMTLQRGRAGVPGFGRVMPSHHA